MPTRFYSRLQVTKYHNLSLKIAMSVPDHSLPARYREWSGTSNFVSSGGCIGGQRLGYRWGFAYNFEFFYLVEDLSSNHSKHGIR